jgi:4-amino-4-deoxy-L-arabinose transferase-like glycosyltransferase
MRGSQHFNRRIPGSAFIWLMIILLIALFLRVYHLDSLPHGPYYDEAANGLLGADIAQGRSRPLFIQSYTGKEVLYFYLVAGVMKLLGVHTFALRLTSALISVLTVGLTYVLVREMFATEGEERVQWLALFSAALTATSFWNVIVSRYGLRAISQSLLQTLTLYFLWKGLRRERAWVLALGGVFCGATAYTYLASRAFPLVLFFFFLWILIADRRAFRKRVGQILLFGAVAGVVFVPLGYYFLTHPQTFSVRMGQVGLLNLGEGDGADWAMIWRTICQTAGMFSVRGSPNWRFNIAGQPVFGVAISTFFYIGLLLSINRVVRGRERWARRACFLTLVTVPVMLLPTALALDEVPHYLRAVGVMPLLFVFPALGLVTALLEAKERLPRLRLILPAALALLLIIGGALTFWRYFVTWANESDVYYLNDGDVADAARYLNQWERDRQDIFVSSTHYQHPTMAFLTPHYSDIHWLVGNDTVVFPTGTDRDVLYVFPHQMQPRGVLLERFFPWEALLVEGQGMVGASAFSAYLFTPEQLPRPVPEHPQSANLGGVLEFLGYDVVSPVSSGENVEFTLYWRVLQATSTGDWSMFVSLRDRWGFQWGRDDFFDYPSLQWRPGDVIVSCKRVKMEAGAPPGEYWLAVGTYSASLDAPLPSLDEKGRVAGDTITLGPLMVTRATQPPSVASLGIQEKREEVLGGVLAFLGYDWAQREVRSGEELYPALYWQARQDVAAGYEVTIRLRGQDGSEWPLWQGAPVQGAYPTEQWIVGEVVKDRYALVVDPDIPPGEYDVELLVGVPDGEPLTTAAGEEVLSLGRLRIEVVDRQFAVPDVQYPLRADLDGQVELLGYDLGSETVQAGDDLRVRLYWRASSEMAESYTVFTHLLDVGGQVWGQKDNPPLEGSYPTTLWVAGEVVSDEYVIPVRDDAPSGEYMIEVGMYRLETGERLPVLDGQGQAVGNRVLLGPVAVERALP